MKVYKEVIPLSNNDALIIRNSEKIGFDYPIHSHLAYELTLVMNSSGNRIIGDSVEKYGGNDLVLIGSGVYHKWDDEDVPKNKKNNAHVITIQFSKELFNESIFLKKPFYSINALLKDSRRGIKFTDNTLKIVSSKILKLVLLNEFDTFIEFLKILHTLSVSTDKTCLASEEFISMKEDGMEDKINTIYSYILNHFSDCNLRITELADRFNMSPSAFGHFFKEQTNKNFSQFLIALRLRHASTYLLNSSLSINEIAYKTGFNNISNFNRLFKKNKSITPKKYRKNRYKATQFDWETQLAPNQFVPLNKNVADDYLKQQSVG